VAIVEKLTGLKFDNLPFMNALPVKILGFDVHATRCGYTGEDGFEVRPRGMLYLIIFSPALILKFACQKKMNAGQ
jgi:hypothetical protein